MREYVRDQLRQQIVDGTIPGGSRLVQTQVAHDLAVSTTPVREALLDLASEGLVKFDSHRGAVVSQPNMEELWEIFELRRVLEPMVMHFSIPKMTPDVIDRLADLCSRMESTSDPTVWVPLNREFHGVFMTVSAMPRLASFVSLLHDNATSFLSMSMRFRPEMMREGDRDHRVMVEAARTGDSATAIVCARDHMNITMTAINDLFPGVAEGANPRGSFNLPA